MVNDSFTPQCGHNHTDILCLYRSSTGPSIGDGDRTIRDDGMLDRSAEDMTALEIGELTGIITGTRVASRAGWCPIENVEA